jgi:hypothetical protein
VLLTAAALVSFQLAAERREESSLLDAGTIAPRDRLLIADFTETGGDPNAPSVIARFKAGGIGPFAGGYGFGVRSTLLGYFLRLDSGWEMNGLFKGEPFLHFAMGLDF